jgi:hypothetical protein
MVQQSGEQGSGCWQAAHRLRAHHDGCLSTSALFEASGHPDDKFSINPVTLFETFNFIFDEVLNSKRNFMFSR